ncbi:putative Phosphate ABC transporter, periplasmic phosphate-binding protein PstS [Magnetospirillum sp. XM-1]|uniref:substrate-binding domain-containing protein n=1 Tax=Magnetospirillum sp. XM-1 TaxID=1663591 RepID=UPI00073DC7C5|nr:substrate-binding domain-containing protein [Magnetospirillum sp. XM-1]CUW38002.1 putative Phosphate ABC transporter, periplasmic phosphate-binding protein PstS [Magnetospirillum sp. XM-1]
MKTTLSTLSLCLALLAPGAAGAADEIRLGGSTTLLPSVSTCASDFMEKYKTWDKADPSLAKKDIVIFVSGGGSGFGVQAVVNGTVDVGLVSRELKAEEKKALGEFQALRVGTDAVAFAANKDNPLLKAGRNQLSRADVAAILSGEKATYAEIAAGLPATEVVLLVRDAGAGSAEIIQRAVMGDKAISAKALQMPSQGNLAKKLERSPAAMGYISVGLAQGDAEIGLFAYEGVPPTVEAINNGSYTLARPMLLVSRAAPTANVRRFLDYLMTDCQKVVTANGFIGAAR